MEKERELDRKDAQGNCQRLGDGGQRRQVVPSKPSSRTLQFKSVPRWDLITGQLKSPVLPTQNHPYIRYNYFVESMN